MIKFFKSLSQDAKETLLTVLVIGGLFFGLFSAVFVPTTISAIVDLRKAELLVEGLKDLEADGVQLVIDGDILSGIMGDGE